MNLELDEVEKTAAAKFRDTHYNKCGKDKYLGAIGGQFKWLLIETSVGTFGSIECGICKETENVTNYDVI